MGHRMRVYGVPPSSGGGYGARMGAYGAEMGSYGAQMRVYGVPPPGGSYGAGMRVYGPPLAVVMGHRWALMGQE